MPVMVREGTGLVNSLPRCRPHPGREGVPAAVGGDDSQSAKSHVHSGLKGLSDQLQNSHSLWQSSGYLFNDELYVNLV